MALQKEIWINSIIGQLFPDNTFASRSVDHSAFVDGKTVHVPNAGSMAPAQKTKPVAAQTRTDVDLDYELYKYYVPWIDIERLEQVELSYNKRESVVAQMVETLKQGIYVDLIADWLPGGFVALPTTGAATANVPAGGSGTRKLFVLADVRAIKRQFDLWDIPQEGRCLLLDAEMHNNLLQSLTEAQSNAFLAAADAKQGIVGRIYGFDVYLRSLVLYSNAGVLTTSPSTGTSYSSLAWWDKAVSRAVGEVHVYSNNDQAEAYGDRLSADCHAGGSNIRSDGKGVMLIYQGT